MFSLGGTPLDVQGFYLVELTNFELILAGFCILMRPGPKVVFLHKPLF